MMILLVDDDPDIRESAQSMLELYGFDVRTAEHGRAALDLMNSGFKPDVVLLDLMMPVLNGIEFLRIIRGDPRFSRMRVVVCTAFADMGRQLRAEHLPFHALFEKPIDFGQLVTVLREGNGNHRSWRA
ncbi:MAG TPA: response regulator [Polyangiaceae bacterium]